MSNKEQLYKALKIAAEKIGQNNYKIQVAAYLKKHKNLKKFRFTVTPEHAEIVKAMGDVLDDKISLEHAMSLLHQYDTLKQRFSQESTVYTGKF